MRYLTLLFSWLNLLTPSPLLYKILPKINNLLRAANRARAKLGPKTPINLSFYFVLPQFLANFIQRDIIWNDAKGNTQRIVIYATKRRLKKLTKARRWEADGTFSFVPKPFHQLFGIHTTIGKKDNVKSVPLLFALMSCRTTIAYVNVFQKQFSKNKFLIMTQSTIEHGNNI